MSTVSPTRPLPSVSRAEMAELRAAAIDGARRVTDLLQSLGVPVRIVGSLAKGTFGPYSDIDFLVLSCPPALKYAIEGRVEDALSGHPFDVIYLDDIPDAKSARFLEYAVDARDLR